MPKRRAKPKKTLARISGADLRRRLSVEEFDITTLKAILRDYENPNKKIHDLLAQGVITGIKRGIYVFSHAYNRRPISLEILANMIYGPSALSLEWALSYHGLIPERVTVITSISTSKSRSFKTVLGNFTYRQLSSKMYSYGIQRILLADKRAFLLASPEKALADYVEFSVRPKLRSARDARTFLLEEMRIDETALPTLNLTQVRKIARLYESERLFNIYDALEDLTR